MQKMEDSKYSSFMAFDEGDRSTASPKLVFTMTALVDSNLSVTLPYYINFNIRRLEDNVGKPLIFRWSPYQHTLANAGLVLLHMTDQGPKKVDVHPDQSSKPDPDTILVNGWNGFLWELQPGGEIDIQAELTGNYQQLLKPGETYELLWPGGKMEMWDWGSVKEHMGEELKNNKLRGEESVQLILPATGVVAFTAKEEDEPWPNRPQTNTDFEFCVANLKERMWRLRENRKKNPPKSPPPIDPSEREPGASILSMELECQSEWKADSTVMLTTKVTYEGVPGEQKPEAITFHRNAFTNSPELREGIRLYRQRNGDWETFKVDDDDEGCSGFLLYTDEPIPFNVGDENGAYSDHFVSLRSGESWSDQKCVQNGSSHGWTKTS